MTERPDNPALREAIKARWTDMPHNDVDRCVLLILNAAEERGLTLSEFIPKSSYLAVETEEEDARLAYVHRGYLRLRHPTEATYTEHRLLLFQQKHAKPQTYNAKLCPNCFLALPSSGAPCRCQEDFL